jgi:hypothetical protein
MGKPFAIKKGQVGENRHKKRPLARGLFKYRR